MDLKYDNDLLALSRMAISQPDDKQRLAAIDEYFHKPGGPAPIVDLIRNDGGDIEAILVNDGKHTIVAFPPTHTNEERESALKHDLVPGPNGGLVHHGYWEHLTGHEEGKASLLDKVKASLSEHGGSLPVTYTGYSMGGGIATLMAAEHTKEFGAGSIEHVVTFGQPKIGDANFAARYNAVLGDKHERFTTADLVTLLPPEPVYKHVGSELYLREFANEQNGAGNYYIETDTKILAALEEKLTKRLHSVIGTNGHTYEDVVMGLLTNKMPEIKGTSHEDGQRLISTAYQHTVYDNVGQVDPKITAQSIRDSAENKFRDGLSATPEPVTLPQAAPTTPAAKPPAKEQAAER